MWVLTYHESVRAGYNIEVREWADSKEMALERIGNLRKSSKKNSVVKYDKFEIYECVKRVELSE
jgi:hypothetical protein